jgi:hypothetical protein
MPLRAGGRNLKSQIMGNDMMVLWQNKVGKLIRTEGEV